MAAASQGPRRRRGSVWASRALSAGRRVCSLTIRDRRGISTVEYVILLVLLCAVGVMTWRVFGQRIKCWLAIVDVAADGSETVSTCSDSEAAGFESTTSRRVSSNQSGFGCSNNSQPRPGSSTTPATAAPPAAPPPSAAPPLTPAQVTAAQMTKDILAVMCPQDKAFLQDLQRRGVTVTAYDRIYFDDPCYNGSTWTTCRFEAGGTTSGTDINMIRNSSAQEDAAVIYHEGVHTGQPSNLAWREKEYDAYIKEDQWRISHGLPPHTPSFRTTDKAGNQTTNAAAVRKFVDKNYPGVTSGARKSEQIIGRTPSGDTEVQRADGTTYTRKPKKGDSFSGPQVAQPPTGIPLDMAKLQCP
jgi:hypothetical protein